jgi:hypothetical protein
LVHLWGTDTALGLERERIGAREKAVHNYETVLVKVWPG